MAYQRTERSPVSPRSLQSSAIPAALLSFWERFGLPEALLASARSRSAGIVVRDFALGEILWGHLTPEASEQPGLWVVCEGRVRLVGEVGTPESSGSAPREVSLSVLQSEDFFGYEWSFGSPETLLPGFGYRVVAASTGQVAFLPAPMLMPYLAEAEQSEHSPDRSLTAADPVQPPLLPEPLHPSLQQTLAQGAVERQGLWFFKTQVDWAAAQSGRSKGLTSYQLSLLLPLLQRQMLSPGASLGLENGQETLTNAADDGQEDLSTGLSQGYCWLAAGTVSSREQQVALPTIGQGWRVDPSSPWQAVTTVQVYHLPLATWETAIALIPSLGNWLGTETPEQPETAAKGKTQQRRGAQPSRALGLAAVRGDRPASLANAEPTSPSEDSAPQGSNVIPFPKPSRKNKRYLRWGFRYPFIEQQSSSDCGVACLAMISQYWGRRYPLYQLRDWARVGRSGTTLRNLAATAEKLGFHSRPVRASLGRLAEQSYPWVAHWQGDHYVVIYRVRKQAVLVADPAAGKRWVKRSDFLANWTGYALILEPTERLKQVEAPKAQSLGHFGRHLLTYWPQLGQIILLSLMLQVFGLASPMFTQIILDQVIVNKSASALNVFALGLVIFGVWQLGLGAVRQYLLDYFSNRLNLTLISGFVSHTLRLPLKFFEDRNVGDILTRIQENGKIQQFLMRQAISTWLDASMAIVYIGLMLHYNQQLSFLVLGMIPPMIILTLLATPFLKQLSREIFKEASEQNSLLVEMMSGVATVKSVAAEQEIRWRWEERLVSLINVQFKGQKLGIGLQTASSFINTMGSTALLWYGASLVIQEQLTIGQFVAFNMLIGRVLGPVLAIIGIWDELQEVLISVERLNDVFAAQPEETPGAPMFALPAIHGDVQFDDVTFSYDGASDHNILHNLSFRVKAGQTIAIVGRSGSGKSTLAKLLQGLYHPTKGRILIDGHDIRHVSPQSLRSQLGVVPQECFLFTGTILDNIQLYRSEFSLDQAIEVAKLAEAHPFIQDLPLGYNTKVGERGANLSGGQRQRIAIARALLGNPGILILDEATSSLDTESERRFQRNLEQISRDRTTFIIAHRLSTVQHADCILVLDRGILVEQGDHDALIEKQGLYYHLAQQQLNL